MNNILRFTLTGISMTSLAVCAGARADVTVFEQGFEADASDWFDFGGTITQAPSGGGTLGVVSADGSFHAEVVIGPSTGNGAFTRFGGYTYTWPGKIVQSLDVYIDPAQGAAGDGWFLDNAVNDDLNNDTGVTPSSDWREAGGVGAIKGDSGSWWIAADADGGAYPGTTAGGVGLEITSAGWYTIVSEWVENVGGSSVDRNTFIYDSSGVKLYEVFNLAQVPLGSGSFPIGGHRYGWIASSGTSANTLTLAIDNSSLAIPEPTSLALLTLGGLVMSRRRR